MLTKVIRPIIPLLLRIVRMFTPLRHQLQPMFLRLLQPHRQRMSVRINIFPHHIHQLYG